jgi:hypothetical protein
MRKAVLPLVSLASCISIGLASSEYRIENLTGSDLHYLDSHCVSDHGDSIIKNGETTLIKDKNSAGCWNSEKKISWLQKESEIEYSMSHYMSKKAGTSALVFEGWTTDATPYSKCFTSNGNEVSECSDTKGISKGVKKIIFYNNNENIDNDEVEETDD